MNPHNLCDRCGDDATEFDANGSAWCIDCAEHVAKLRLEAAGINTLRRAQHEEAA